MKTFLSRSRWAAIGAAVAVSLGGGAVFVANAAISNGETYVPIRPCRLLDTRPTDLPRLIKQTGVRASKIGPVANAGADQRLNNDITVYFDPLASNLGDCGFAINPGDNPVAVHINITVPVVAVETFLTVYPWEFRTGEILADKDPDIGRPWTSILNAWKSGYAIQNAATVGLDAITTVGPDKDLRAFRVFNYAGQVDVIIDVLGYYK